MPELDSFVFGLTGNSDVIRITAASRARKVACEKRLKYYWDLQNEETLRLISQRFSKPEQFRLFNVNMVRAITNRRASTYRVPPRRTFHGADQAVCEAFYKAMGADSVLKHGSRYVELCRTAFLQVSWNEATSQPRLSVLTPNVLDAVYVDPENPDRIIVTHGADRAEHTSYSDWTANSFKRLNARGASMQVEGNPGNRNPYGSLPFVVWHERVPDDCIWLPGGEDLVSSQEAVNVALANLWRSVELQAHGQSWASGISAGELLQFGPDRTIALPQNGQFGFAAPNSPISSILEAIEFTMRQTAATHSVGSDVFNLSKSAISGSAISAGRLELKEARQDAIAQARQAEAKLFQIVKAVVNTHRPGEIPDNATVAVDFAEADDRLTEAEQLANAQIKTELGVWSPVDVLMNTDRDAFPDRDAAFRELKRRNDETAALAAPL